MSTLTLILLALSLSTADAKPNRGSSGGKKDTPTAGSERRDPPSRPARPAPSEPAPTTRTPPSTPSTPSRSEPAPAPSTPRDTRTVEPSGPRTMPSGPRPMSPQPTPAPEPTRTSEGFPRAVQGDPLGTGGTRSTLPTRPELPQRGGTPFGAESKSFVPGELLELTAIAGARADSTPPPERGYQVDDGRYARPNPRHVRDCPYAYDPVPNRWTYHPWYSRWYVHPYYRWQYGTYVVIHTGYGSFAWVDTWAPAPRAGWTWVNGYWAGGYWNPGYWAPVSRAPVGYAYVPGYWYSSYYVEGYYRADERDDGDWQWVEGQYLEDGTYVPGHWRPTTPGPEGYVWEPGFWDGEAYVDGFWRPMYRDGFLWSSAYFDEQGVYHSGFWKPLEIKPAHVWVPGWFDGNTWIEGYWVHEGVYRSQRPEDWEGPDGYDAGWDEGSGWGDGEVVERKVILLDQDEDESAPATPADAPKSVEEEDDPRPLGIPVE